jgi:hypothetical protein
MNYAISGLAIYSSLFPLYMYILFYQQLGKIAFGISYQPYWVSFLFFGFFALVLCVLLTVYSLLLRKRLRWFTYTVLFFTLVLYIILGLDSRDIVGIVLD